MTETSRESETEDAVLEVRRIGDSLGLILPDDLLTRLRHGCRYSSIPRFWASSSTATIAIFP